MPHAERDDLHRWQKWYKGLRPDLRKPRFGRLWAVARKMRDERLTSVELPDDDLGSLLMEAVYRGLEAFDAAEAPLQGEPRMAQRERVYHWVKRKLRWLLVDEGRRIRREARRSRRDHSRWQGPRAERWMEEAPAPKPRDILVTAVMRALSTAAEQDRDLLNAKHLDGATHDDIKERFGFASLHYARKAVEQAEGRLRAVVERDYDEKDFL